MGAFLDKPKTQKVSEEGSGNGLKFGVSCMQGWRIEMEDAHRIVYPLPGQLSAWSYFSIFDGHAGSKVAKLASSNLINTILNQPEFETLKNDASQHGNQDLIRTGIVNGFLKFDDELKRDEKSGSTAIVAFVTPKFIILANCGDSRAMIVSGGQVRAETIDHKPADHTEMTRITAAGGTVVLQRINGALAVSRSLGDFEYKNNSDRRNTEQLVIAEPDVTFFARDPSKDQFLFLACDGIWDVFNSDTLKTTLLYRLQCEESLAKITEELLDHCLHLNSRDNMSALIVGLDNCPTVDATMRATDIQVNKDIETISEELCLNHTKNYSMLELCDAIEQSAILNLDSIPGGLTSKRYIVDAVYNKHNCVSESLNEEPVRYHRQNYSLSSNHDQEGDEETETL